VKILRVFDPHLDADQDPDARWVNTLQAAKDHLATLTLPAAFHVHEFRVSNDPQTVACMLNGDFCWPAPVRAWKGTARGGLRRLFDEPAASEDNPADRIQAAEAARGA
jgi:hypothetical protein